MILAIAVGSLYCLFREDAGVNQDGILDNTILRSGSSLLVKCKTAKYCYTLWTEENVNGTRNINFLTQGNNKNLYTHMWHTVIWKI